MGGITPDGKVCGGAAVYNGVLIGATRFRKIRFIHTGPGEHGLLISRDARHVLVSNRNAGSVSVIAAASPRWCAPGGSPAADRCRGQRRPPARPAAASATARPAQPAAPAGVCAYIGPP
jgi:hypothetical protein